MKKTKYPGSNIQSEAKTGKGEKQPHPEGRQNIYSLGMFITRRRNLCCTFSSLQVSNKACKEIHVIGLKSGFTKAQQRSLSVVHNLSRQFTNPRIRRAMVRDTPTLQSQFNVSFVKTTPKPIAIRHLGFKTFFLSLSRPNPLFTI